MRKIYLLHILLIALFFTSCEKIVVEDLDESSSSADETTTGINISCDIEDAYQTRAAVSAKDQVTRIAWALMKTDGTIVSQGEQTSESTSFGKLSINCDAGSYKLLVFGHKAASACTVEDGGLIALPDNKCTDAFYTLQEVTVKKNKRQSLSCTLDRCVAKFHLESTDVMPNNVTGIRFTFENTSIKFNSILGKGEAAKSYSRIVAIDDTRHGKVFNCNLYCFMPEAEANIGLKFEFTDESGNTIFLDSFKNVPMKINHVTTYTGAVFTTAGIDSDNIMVNADWGDDITIDESYLE